MSTIHDIWYQTFLIQHDIILNEMGMTKYSQIKYISIVDTSNSLFIIKDCYGKFHHSISQIPLIIPNTIFRNFTLFFLSTLHKKLKRNTNLNQTEIKSWKMNNTNIQWNLWRVISLQLQHGGMSDGGGNIWASGCLPFFTMNAVSMPQVRWRSTWQCMNHTPATEKIYQHYT